MNAAFLAVQLTLAVAVIGVLANIWVLWESHRDRVHLQQTGQNGRLLKVAIYYEWREWVFLLTQLFLTWLTELGVATGPVPVTTFGHYLRWGFFGLMTLRLVASVTDLLIRRDLRDPE